MRSWWSRVEACRLCGAHLTAGDLMRFMELPVAGAYVSDLSAPAAGDPAAPLTATRCPGCGLVQLRERLDPAFYRSYGFTGGLGGSYRGYLAGLAGRIAASLPGGAQLIEVGCGDGTLLVALREQGLKVCGFEPADHPRREAVRKGLAISPAYLTAETFGASGFPRSGCIVARHVLEHVDDLASLLGGIDAAAGPDAHLLVEVPDLAETAAAGMYGNIYHAHACYFDRATLAGLLSRHGWQVTGACIVPTFGGSLLMSAGRGVAVGMPLRVTEGYPYARIAGDDALAEFARGWAAFSEALGGSLRSWRAAGLLVAGYGAAERTGSLVGAAGLGVTDLACLYDKNPFLAGKALPRTRIPIRTPGRIGGDCPDILVVFAQSHEQEIVRELAPLCRGGMRLAVLRARGPELLEVA